MPGINAYFDDGLLSFLGNPIDPVFLCLLIQSDAGALPFSSLCSECADSYDNFLLPFNSISECQEFTCEAVCTDCAAEFATAFTQVYGGEDDCIMAECPVACGDCQSRFEE